MKIHHVEKLRILWEARPERLCVVDRRGHVKDSKDKEMTKPLSSDQV